MEYAYSPTNNTAASQPSTAILLVNVGTPDSPNVPDVRRYLSEFLNDPRVIDLPWLGRKLLVNGIIVPFRAPKSAKLYRQLWTQNGSPLLYHTQNFAKALQAKLANRAAVFYAMRYRKPSLTATIDQILSQGYKRIVVSPMFPHYASSTTGTIHQEVMRYMRKKNVIPEIAFLGHFFDETAYLDAFTTQIAKADPAGYDHVLFSYHGLPQRHVERTHIVKKCDVKQCKTTYDPANCFCYHATCYRTTALLAQELGLKQGQYGTAFQSRLGKGWLEPFSDVEVERLAKEGVKKLLVVSPAFVADCLETVIEIGHEYNDIFKQNGGQQLTLVESLNDSPLWVDGFAQLLSNRFGV